MIGTELAALALVLLPGFLALRMIRFASINPPLGQWMETLWSLSLTGMGYAACLVVPRCDPMHLFARITGADASANVIGQPEVLRALAFGTWCTLAIGLLVALLSEWRRFRDLSSVATARTIIEAPWNNIAAAMRDRRLMVEVETEDGQAFVGILDMAGTDPEDRSVVLAKAARSINEAGQRVCESLEEQESIYIPGDRIAKLSVIQSARLKRTRVWVSSRVGAVLAWLAVGMALHLSL